MYLSLPFKWLLLNVPVKEISNTGRYLRQLSYEIRLHCLLDLALIGISLLIYVAAKATYSFALWQKGFFSALAP